MNSCYFAAFPRRVEKAAKKRTDTLGKLHLPLVSNTFFPADSRQWVTRCHFLGRTQKFCVTMSQPEQTILGFSPSEHYKCSLSCPQLNDCPKTHALPKGLLMVVDLQGNSRNNTAGSINVYSPWLPPAFWRGLHSV